MTVSRRGVLKGSAAATVAGGAALAPAGPVRAAPPGEDGRLVVRRAINVGVSVHRPGGMLALDGHNVIWTLPLAGGTARRLTDDMEDGSRPSFFPDGRSLAFQSFRNGSYDIAVVGLGSREVTRLTPGPQYDLDPAVSPDGRAIAYVSDSGGTSAVWLWDAPGGRSRPLVGTDDERSYHSPAWHPGGHRLSYVAGDASVETYDLRTGAVTVVHRAGEGVVLRGTGHGPGGRLSWVFVSGPRATLSVDGVPVTGRREEPAPLPAAWLSGNELVYSGDGRLWRRRVHGDGPGRSAAGRREIPFALGLAAPAARPARRRPAVAPADAPVQGLVAPVISPDGESVCFGALGALWIQRFGERPRRVVADGYANTDPDWLPDGSGLVYSSDRDGGPDLWRFTPCDGRHERLTRRAEGALRPRVSPDGGLVAYHDEAGATRLLNLTDGTGIRLAAPTDHPGRAAFSPDGRLVSMAVQLPGSERDPAGLHGLRTVDRISGTVEDQAVAPHRSIGTRGDDGPVWAPDGRHLLVIMDSLLHRVPVAPDGTVTGEPVALSSLLADSVSVSSRGQVLFLSLGEPVLLAADGRSPHRRRRVRLTCRSRPAPPRTVIRAGRLWDGVSDGYRRNVDILVEDGSITSVTRVRPGGAAPTVDASDLTVVPGLIDTHNHWHMRGGSWGSRQGPLWLAYGVTTSRSTGDPVYRMAETREALRSGALVGPRFLGSGEPLDGTRVSFGFMRAVSGEEQLERELRRAEFFDYDVVKSYQRLPVPLERRIVRRLARRGTPVTSHYVYPAAHTGLYGMEHTGGGNRLGYSRTLGAAGGRTAQDTVDLLVASGMWVSTTLLFAGELYAGGAGAVSADLLHDHRTRTLFPPWEYARLLAKAERADRAESELDAAWTAGDVDLLLRVHERGGLVVAGTDAPLDDVGISIHQNLRALVRHGFSPVAALRTATVNAARCLGAEGLLGAVRPGARADLLVLDGDPLRNIADTARVERVFVDGHSHTVPELLAPFEGADRTPASPSARFTAEATTARHPNCCRDHPGRPSRRGR
ncbi:amidohydrolase [Streptomyces sp. WZ.A104]|uniref:amidohydrolase family protein n=1 Tax=Streptomyces sp. WZ.A104 TaxID=2023771 RepID=UPI000BBCC182|nr:amidohydrolase family protein [Streptomyces sp. WZ.A104]PCG85250.1 amidohydrolase [Streptomyces sp. WZ.A104]